MVIHQIEAHRAAVMADEANFDDDGTAVDEAKAKDSGNREAEAFKLLVREQCTSAADVQAKLDYFLNGAIGQRSSLLDYLFEESHGAAHPYLTQPPLEAFLRSLVITP